MVSLYLNKSNRDHALEMTDSISHMGEIRWPLLGTLVLSWVIIYLCLFKGIKSAGKVYNIYDTF